MKEILDYLYANQDKKYAEFQSMLVPSVGKEKVIGVRTPVLRSYAKKLYGSELADRFVAELPHTYFEENQLHAFIIGMEKDFDKCISMLETFLPFVDNWATCDQMSPRCFKAQHRKSGKGGKSDKLDKLADKWIGSRNIYTIRFGIKVRMDHFLKEDFDIKYPIKIAKIKSEEYYIRMMIAWYFATALAMQYNSVVSFIENKELDVWTHNKTIQKAVESFRISDEQKIYLKSLKIR